MGPLDYRPTWPDDGAYFTKQLVKAYEAGLEDAAKACEAYVAEIWIACEEADGATECAARIRALNGPAR